MNENKKHPLAINKTNQSDWLNKLEQASGKPLEKGSGQFLSSGSNLDIVFAFDTTGSMYSYLEEVKRNLNEITGEIKEAIPNSQLGVIAYADYCDEVSTYLTKKMDFCKDTHMVKNFINSRVVVT